LANSFLPLNSIHIIIKDRREKEVGDVDE
jgi:hypothetical protein